MHKQNFLNQLWQYALEHTLENKNYSLSKKLLLLKDKISNNSPIGFNDEHYKFLHDIVINQDLDLLKVYIKHASFLNLWGEIGTCIHTNNPEMLKLVLKETIYSQRGFGYTQLEHNAYLKQSLDAGSEIFDLIIQIPHSNIDDGYLFKNLKDKINEPYKWQKIIDLFLNQELKSNKHLFCILVLFSDSFKNPNILNYLLEKPDDKNKIFNLFKQYVGNNIVNNFYMI